MRFNQTSVKHKKTLLTHIADYCNQYVGDIVTRKDLLSFVPDHYSDSSVDTTRCQLMNVGFLRKTGKDGNYEVRTAIPYMNSGDLKKLVEAQNVYGAKIHKCTLWEWKMSNYSGENVFINAFRASNMTPQEYADAHSKVLDDQRLFEDWISLGIMMHMNAVV